MLEQSEALKTQMVVFLLDEQRYGLPLRAVDSVVRMVEITQVPGLPPYIQGIINVHGVIMAVISLRKRMHLNDRPEALTDQLIITRCRDRSYALMVDGVSEVLSLEEQNVASAESVLPERAFLTSIVKAPGGMILLNDVDTLLALGDQEQIDSVLKQVKL